MYDNSECTNRNYISDEVSTWLLTSVADNTYEVYMLDGEIDYTRAARTHKIQPIVFLVKDALISSGNGTYEKPYVIKY